MALLPLNKQERVKQIIAFVEAKKAEEDARHKALFDEAQAKFDARRKAEQAGRKAREQQVLTEAGIQDAREQRTAKAAEAAAAQKPPPSPTEGLTLSRVDQNRPEANLEQDPGQRLTPGGPQGPATQPAGSRGGGVSAGAPVGGPPVPGIPEAPPFLTTTRQLTQPNQPNVFLFGEPVSRGPVTTTETVTRPNVLTQYQRQVLLETRRRNLIDEDLARKKAALDAQVAAGQVAASRATQFKAEFELRSLLQKERERYLGGLAEARRAVKAGIGDPDEIAVLKRHMAQLPPEAREELTVIELGQEYRDRRTQDLVTIEIENEAGVKSTALVPKVSVGPEGRVIEQGTAASLAGLSKPVVTRLQGDILNTTEALARLDGIEEEYHPAYLTAAVQKGLPIVQAARRNTEDGGVAALSAVIWALPAPKSQALLRSLGVESRDQLTTAHVDLFLNRTGNFNAAVSDNLSRYVKFITGAQLSRFESDRIMRSLPKLDDDEATFGGKIERIRRDLKLGNLRARLFLSGGFGDESVEAALAIGRTLPNLSAEDPSPKGDPFGLGSSVYMEQVLGRVDVRRVPQIVERLIAGERDMLLKTDVMNARQAETVAWIRVAHAFSQEDVLDFVQTVAPERAAELAGPIRAQLAAMRGQ